MYSQVTFSTIFPITNSYFLFYGDQCWLVIIIYFLYLFYCCDLVKFDLINVFEADCILFVCYLFFYFFDVVELFVSSVVLCVVDFFFCNNLDVR